MKYFCVLVIHIQFLLASSTCFSADEVFITNFPEKLITQDVNSIPSTALRKIENVEVGTFTSMEVIDLSPKYMLDTAGYTKANVSLFGFPKAKDFADCQVGFVLLPNEEAIWKAWQVDRAMILSKELKTKVTDKTKYFQGQIEIDIHFPSYMVGFFNTCATNVEVNMYSYLK
ncbi:MAG: hypothetical protein JRE56_05145 [Deltaproteobacteria bacterium]|jgi:hypothetical protein|nr:hypothetical protein [Deltaproteobacteria bacterium]MBW2511199.1 hypothetical protein [Deltaproteobacteria bacterium]